MTLRQPRADVTAVELFRQLVQGAPIMDGALVPVSTAAATTEQSAPHPLGRAYRGGWLVSADKALPLTVLSPAGRANVDARVYFRLTSAMTATATLWVF